MQRVVVLKVEQGVELDPDRQLVLGLKASRRQISSPICWRLPEQRPQQPAILACAILS